MNLDAEQALENRTLQLCAELGWETCNAYNESFTPAQASPARPYLGRENRGQVALLPRLHAALARLNPTLPEAALELAIEELTRDRAALQPTAANREVYALLRDGVKVPVKDAAGHETLEVVRVIAWEEPAANDFLMVQQLWIAGELHNRRADLVGFVNGLPLFFGELKAHHKQLANAYRDNLCDYRETIPQLFRYNALALLSNGSAAVLGSCFAPWEHFNAWKKINAEGEQGVISLETALRGTCAPARCLDIVEHYILYHEGQSGLEKILAKTHQYFGVEAALQAARNIAANRGRLGVFWHTQGSGKSFSMAFFTQKLLRRFGGHWTFVIVTDRLDLDDQIYKTFARCGLVAESEEQARASSGADLQQKLREDHRYLFTLIQKFHAPAGTIYPVLSERDDIIVITDEAHRSQYDALALNMRRALPNAAFIGFTGTPLMVGEERTREVFGDYVSIYNFRQSVEDGATVPLYYENRIPELQLVDEALNTHLGEVLEAAELDDTEEDRLAREFVREYQLLTRDDRLEKIAADIVDHFLGRGFQGKAMVVSIDKLTTVRMYDKVQAHWRRRLEVLREELRLARTEEQRASLRERLATMEQTDMAVVVSQEQNELRKFREAGLEIRPHRERMVKEHLDEKFKDPTDPFRIVFVCAMWRTGFDAPSCSTLYLDRPMRDHTLMQTIARVNRVFGAKLNGLIVDYVGIFRLLQEALAIYGSASGGGVKPGEYPVADKAALVAELQAAMTAAEAFCTYHDVNLAAVAAEKDPFQRIARLEAAVEAILVDDADKSRFLTLVAQAERLFQAILPDTSAAEFQPRRALLALLAQKIRLLEEGADPDLSAVARQVGTVLDDAIVARQYVIREGPRYDLSKVDFDALAKQFTQGKQRTAAERLRGILNVSLRALIRRNRSRMDFQAEFQQLIDEYNAGNSNIETYFRDLVDLAQRLEEEEQRAIREQLSEAELAVFDILTRPDLHLTAAEERQVKGVARELLKTLERERLVLDWRKRQQDRAAVKVTIADALYGDLPERFTAELCAQKADDLYHHIYETYADAATNVYAAG